MKQAPGPATAQGAKVYCLVQDICWVSRVSEYASYQTEVAGIEVFVGSFMAVTSICSESIKRQLRL